MDVAVLYGGWSNERPVSLTSGNAVAEGLRASGHSVRLVDVSRDVAALLKALTPLPDVVFNALHGIGGEDGVIQGVLEMLGVPYTHSGVMASAVGMDKAMTKRLCQTAGIPVAESVVLTKSQILQNPAAMPYPYVVKPVADGSSINVFIIRSASDIQALRAAKADAATLFLLEAYIPGRELTVPVLGDAALTPIEIVAPAGFFDYTAKYDAKQHAKTILPAPMPPAIVSAAQTHAVAAHRLLGCQSVSRSDFRYNPDAPAGEQLFFLEINTQPGMTPLSLLPESAAYAGISYAQLVDRIVKDAHAAHCRPKAA